MVEKCSPSSTTLVGLANKEMVVTSGVGGVNVSVVVPDFPDAEAVTVTVIGDMVDWLGAIVADAVPRLSVVTVDTDRVPAVVVRLTCTPDMSDPY
jgi:hypothetical protein